MATQRPNLGELAAPEDPRAPLKSRIGASMSPFTTMLHTTDTVLQSKGGIENLRVYKEVRGVSEGLPKMKALEQALRSADQLVASSRKSFQAGSRTVLDVLNAEQQRLSVMRDLSQARYIYLISRIRLLSLVGSADLVALTGISQLLVSQ